MTAVLVVHLAATACVTGLIWFVQVVHYPLMAAVGREGYADYQRLHTQRTTFVVGPLMLVEAAAAFWIVVDCLTAADRAVVELPLATCGAVLLAMVWASTFVIQVPLHGRLTDGFDGSAHHRLVSTNWIRTVLWTARTGVAMLMLIKFPDASS